MLLFFVERKGLKCVATVAISFIIGISTNLIGGFSGWKQAIVVIILCFTVFFIHLHRVIEFLIHAMYALQHTCIRRLVRTGSSTISSRQATMQNDIYPQPETNRF